MRPRHAHVRLVAGLVAAALAVGAPACGGDAEEAPSPSASRPEPAAPLADAPTILDAPSVDGVLKLLSQDHRAARRALGRHRLRYIADFSLVPPELPRPQPGEHLPRPREVHDELVLEWAGDDDRNPALSLRQGPDDEAARAIVIVGETVYSRLPHRGWFHRDLDSELHWRWLDDAERCVHDLVEFAAPELAVTRADADADGERVTLKLSRGEGRDAAYVAAGEAQSWRSSATITAIDGSVDFDRASGLWLRAALEVTFQLTDGEGRTLTGSATLAADREPAADLTVTPPAESAPLPERIRYDAERRRLLDGLDR
ncbi:MAG: hypothetical protein KC486_25395 [Myxococcales bacterium]|nr:hypothetical protein [Myxococcales bacterium]